jgi:hypothetical protein
VGADDGAKGETPVAAHMTALDPAALAVRFARVLEAAGVPYAIGGAIAYGFWGVPRGTRDLDVNVFLPADRADAVVETLVVAGLEIDRTVARATALERGDARGLYDDIPVDLFFLSIPLHESAARRTVQVTLLDTPIRVLSAEDLTVFKLLFFRGKDVVDVERLVAVQGDRLDRSYVRSWLVACVGEDDERVRRWDAISAAV